MESVPVSQTAQRASCTELLSILHVALTRQFKVRNLAPAMRRRLKRTHLQSRALSWKAHAPAYIGQEEECGFPSEGKLLSVSSTVQGHNGHL